MRGVEIGGPSVTLREVRLSDAPAIFAFAADEAVIEYLIWEIHADIEVTRAYVRSVLERQAEEPRRSYDLVVVWHDEVVGMGRISHDPDGARRAHIGYVLRRKSWGHGLGTEVASLLVDFGFGYLDLHRIWATTDPENVASQRILEKVGMRCEGRIRDDEFVRGRYRDSFVYALLETDPRPGTGARPTGTWTE